MIFAKVFQPFIDQSPVSVMFRGALENVLAPARLECIFEATAQKQYCHELTFSMCADLLGMVVTRIQPSVHAAYRARRTEIPVSVQSVYEKLAGIEPAVSEALVRETSSDFARIIGEMKTSLPGPLPGFDVRIVDGNHLAGTDHRLKELRRLGDAALPGHSLAVLNPQLELIEEVILCEDGHANQKPLMSGLLGMVQAGQCWIADRDFTTLAFFFGIAQRKAYFVIRQHGVLQAQLLGRRRRLGRIETGMVYEQKIRLTNSEGRQMVVRRVTVELDQPTRDGDTEIHLLTNLPSKLNGRKIAVAYQSRWRIEAAFHKLTMVLRCELNTLGYPDAALFGFCVAVVMYNAVSTVMAALRAAHPRSFPNTDQTGTRRQFSFYYLAGEIAGVWLGMAIAIPRERWTTEFAGQTPKQMAKKLVWLARHVKPDKFFTNRCGVKKRKKPRPMTTRGGHVSTHRILEARKSE